MFGAKKSFGLIGLLSVCVLFALAFAPQGAHATTLIARPQVAPSALENPLAALSLKRLSATQERPLFTPNRRPPAPPAIITQAAPPPPDPPRLTLSAVIVDKEGAVAIVRPDTGATTRRLHMNDDVDGWRVTRIDSQKLVISLGSRSLPILMFKNDQMSKTLAGVHTETSMLEVNAAGPIGQRPAHR